MRVPEMKVTLWIRTKYVLVRGCTPTHYWSSKHGMHPWRMRPQYMQHPQRSEPTGNRKNSWDDWYVQQGCGSVNMNICRMRVRVAHPY
jgi:hypothetical protein